MTALARGLEVLRAFRREGEALGNGDLAKRTGLSKSTISRLVYTLNKLEYLSYDPDTARYRLAPPVLSLGYSCLAGMPVRQLARPYMQ
ncbi:helix-turn-helix domain-containing protein [Cognatishimia sp. D5M38]|uniref:Helix-turn-helix domain-containing protein n=3 Tax=Rhodobacterales TaxID=204455 RepID=A0ABU8QKC1_9RHOB